MKTVVLASSSSSTFSSSDTGVDGGDRSETRDSCYFPGCRKDANCKCEICLASINATLDLIPSTCRSKISNPNPKIKTPIPFDSKILSTPRLRKSRPTSSPLLHSTARVKFCGTISKKKRILGFGGFLIRLILGLGFILGVDLGFSWGISRVLKPELSAKIVQNVTEKARVLQDLDGKLGFLRRELEGLVNGKASDCGSNGSLWKINQDDVLLNSQCTLYKSAAEEVSVWGWPLRTAGLLTAGLSSRSLTILSGGVMEWSYGKVGNLNIKANQSWVHNKWSASIVQLDQNTWIVEYKRAWIIENSRIFSAVLELLKFRLSREINRIIQEFWFLPDFGIGIDGDSRKVPT